MRSRSFFFLWLPAVALSSLPGTGPDPPLFLVAFRFGRPPAGTTGARGTKRLIIIFYSHRELTRGEGSPTRGNKKADHHCFALTTNWTRARDHRRGGTKRLIAIVLLEALPSEAQEALPEHQGAPGAKAGPTTQQDGHEG